MKMRSFYLTDEMIDQLQKIAERRRIAIAEVVRQALKEYMAKHARPSR